MRCLESWHAVEEMLVILTGMVCNIRDRCAFAGQYVFYRAIFDAV